jgi:ubiquinone/menaquinone biosynthesis C-methylase UbiE
MTQEKYDEIGIDYNLTRKADPFIASRLLYHLSPTSTGLYLDIGCGTGNYTSAINEKGISLIGIDPSQEMLDKAKAKNNSIDWRMGKAENLPLENECVNGVMASLTLHHWNSLAVGFKELNRVLLPNGKLVMLTATPKQMEGYWLNHYFPKMLKDSIEQMPAFQQIEQNLTINGFKIMETEPYSIQPDLQDLFLYAGKHDPSLYLNEQVRHGISSFSNLANAEEVAKGLLLLQQDMETGKVNDIIKSYENTTGDYLFIVANKNPLVN